MPSLLNDPEQTETSRETFTASAGHIVYTIDPVFNYDIQGMVVSCSTAFSFDDIYHRNWQDHLNPKDLALIWGKNTSSGIYQSLNFSSGSWTAYVETKYFSKHVNWADFNTAQWSNNHLLCNDSALLRKIRQVERGDQVRIKGMLAEYSHSQGAFHRGTSTTRTDTGSHACETIFVEEFEVLRWANLPWRYLRTLTFWSALLSGIACVWFYFRAPIVDNGTQDENEAEVEDLNPLV